MADKRDKEDKEEKIIPVFTVLKNGRVVKNIFLLDNPSPLSRFESIQSEEEKNGNDSQKNEKEEEEVILIVGRHPDCNIMLEHPSISRFHLQIYSKPSSRILSVIDLSSAHGTWISDRKIEPKVRIDLNEGDTIRLGASTRVYKLHWIPLHRALDVENPFISPNLESLLPIEENDEEEEQIEENNEMENQIQLTREQKQIPSAPPMPENMNSSFINEEEEEEEEEEVDEVLFVVPLIEEDEKKSPSTRLEFCSGSLHSEFANSLVMDGERILVDASNQLVDKENQNTPSPVDINVLSEIENQESPPMKSKAKSNTPNIWSRRGKSATSIQIQTGRSKAKNAEVSSTKVIDEEVVSRVLFSGSDGEEEDEIFTPNKENVTPRSVLGKKLMKKEDGLSEIEIQNYSGTSSKFRSRVQDMELSCSKVMEEKVVSKVLFSDAYQEDEGEMFTPDKENFTPRPVLGKKSPTSRLEEIQDQKYSRSATSDVIGKLNFDEECGETEEEVFTPDKENFTPRLVLGMKSMKKGRSKRTDTGSSISEVGNGVTDEEIITPDKENFTPRPVLGMKSIKRCGLEERKKQNCSGSLASKVKTSPSSEQEESQFYGSDKENLTPVALLYSKSKKTSTRDPVRSEAERIRDKRQQGRVPFQSLLSPNSITKSKSEFYVPNVATTTTTMTNHSVNFSQTIEKNTVSSLHNKSCEEANRRWNLVVDTSCLLNKDSLKSLKLLQGLKGTHLIIPRMVIRELDSLNRRNNLFKRTTEVSAASILEWIEECMVKTSWWIHVQNSLEESMPVAPTPPASPHSLQSEGSSDSFARSVPFSPFGSLMEIVSPTAQDHILECALLFKRLRNNERIVLLTNSLALKIKAMAEGLMCETAEDFRESLVNPYSPRFMWAESTPRGPTWSCLDEGAVLRENKYYQYFPVKKTKAIEGAKGLKLILLHNSSHYGQINTVN